MSRRVLFWVWLAFALTLAVPVTLTLIDDAIRFPRGLFLDTVELTNVILLGLSPTVLGIAVTLHTLRTRQHTRVALLLVSLHVLIGLWPLAAGLGEMGLYGLDADRLASMYTDWWYSGMQFSITLIFLLRLITTWAPSFWSRSLRVLAIACLAFTALLTLFIEFHTHVIARQYVEPWLNSSLAAPTLFFGVLFTAITEVVISIERAMGKRWRTTETTLDKRVPVRLDCPKCGGSMDVLSRVLKRCASCGLGVEVRLDEPRCACGYLMYGFSGDLCPECGVAVPDDLRWWDAKPGESAHPPLSDGEPAPRPEGD